MGTTTEIRPAREINRWTKWNLKIVDDYWFKKVVYLLDTDFHYQNVLIRIQRVIKNV